MAPRIDFDYYLGLELGLEVGVTLIVIGLCTWLAVDALGLLFTREDDDD